MPFEPPEIETDPEVITGAILDGIADRIPGYSPVEGAVEVAVAEEFARETAATNAYAVEVIETAVAGIGETVFGLPALVAAAAEIDVELTVTGVGAIVPAGLLVVGTTGAGIEVAFTTPAELTAPAPVFTTTLTAVEPGTAANGVPVGDLVVATATATVVAAEAVSASAGGLDDETIAAYLDRFTDYVATLSPGGVRASDLAAFARSVPGVGRALGRDLFDPANPGVPAERTVTVFPITAAGLPVDGATATAVEAAVEDVREVNFVVHVANPTYTPVQVAYSAVAEPGADPATVKTSIDAALIDFLSPATWGSTAANPLAWTETTTVRHLQLVRVAGSVPGLLYIASLTLNGGTADVQLAGPAALPSPTTGPNPTTVNGVVTS